MDSDNYDSDEDFNELINIVINPRRPRNFRERVDHFQKWNDTEFLNRFRLSKATVQLLIEEIGPRVESLTNRNHALSPADKVLCTLRYLATGSFLQVVGDFGGFDKGTASRVIHQCLIEIALLRPQFVNMPNTPEEISNVRQEFYNKCRFPRCIGALDCTHIKIQSPGGQEAEIYRNRKGYFSFNVRVICDAQLNMRNIVCRWHGSTADSTIFNHSSVRREMEFHHFGEDSLLVGDAGYPVKNYLMTPLLNPTTPAEALYNEFQIRTRNPIERCFGVFIKRFPILALIIRLHVDKVEAVVVACAVLHNLALNMNDEVPHIDEEVELAIQMGNHRNIDNGQARIAVNEITRFTSGTQYFQNLL